MIKAPLTHPQLLAALAGAGHGSTLLIADANYPVATATNPVAVRIHLNLTAGVVDAPTVLAAILGVQPIEAAAVMMPDHPEPGWATPPLWNAFAAQLERVGVEAMDHVQRSRFYEAARGPELAAVVATGETQAFGNLLLTLGAATSGERATSS